MPRRAPVLADDLTSLGLGPHGFAHLRAVAEGVPVSESAQRYLAIEHGNQAPSAHRLLVERVAAVARRAGDPRWRLVRLRIEEPAGELPSLYAWVQAEGGLDDWSQAEQLQLYQARFRQETPGEHRRRQRNARLRALQRSLLRELEARAGEPASPLDLVDGWLAPALTEALRRLNMLTLAGLQARIGRGGRWWLGLPSYGPSKPRAWRATSSCCCRPRRRRAGRWPPPASAWRATAARRA